MKKNITILGAGMVGKAMAIDLAKKHAVTSVDLNEESLHYLKSKYNVNTVIADLSSSVKITDVIKDADLVISAVPGFMGFKTVECIIKAGKNLVDISFMPEDFLVLAELAKKNNVTAIADCGVAPGMPNVIVGYHNESMKISHFEYMVGGLPKVRTFPFEYKAPFSPVDVIEEYTRPARYVENSHKITKPAMSDPELLEFGKAGTLEAFNTDGLRSLIYTMNDIPNMKEKTLRFPGHIKFIQGLKSAGFFDLMPVEIKGNQVIPFDMTTKLLFKQWKLQADEPEFTVMRVKLKGVENGVEKEIIYDVYDEYDETEMISSMARTTGFTATAGAELVINNIFSEKGIFPPELVGKHKECFNFFMTYLAKRNVIYKKTENLF